MKSSFESTTRLSVSPLFSGGQLNVEVIDGPPVKPGLLEGGIDGLLSTVWKESPENKNARKEFVHYAGGMAKTAALFMPGKYGVIATVGVNVLDSVKWGDSLENQVMDGGLGAAKGLALRGIFATSNYFHLSPATKGVLLGMSMRSLETGLNRQTYIDKDGNYDFQAGLSKVKKETCNKDAIRADILIFGGSHLIQHGLFGNLSSSPFTATILNGGIFGITSGAIGEINRQKTLGGQSIDYSEVVRRALLQGTLDGIAAIPGGMMNRTNYRREVTRIQAEEVESQRRALLESPLQEPLGSPALEVWKQSASTREPLLLINDIHSLPPGDRAAAMVHALKHFPSRDLSFVFRDVPPEHLPFLAKQIGEFSSGQLRSELLSMMPLYAVEKIPAAGEPIKVIAQTFGQVQRLSGEDLVAVRGWWAKLEPAHRHAMAEVLPADFLSRLMFDQSNVASRVLGENLAVTKPEVLRAVARNAGDMNSIVQSSELVSTLHEASLARAVRKALDGRVGAETVDHTMVQDALGIMFTTASARERVQIAKMLGQAVLEQPTTSTEPRVSLAFSLAGRFTATAPAVFEKNVWRPVNETLANASHDYGWRAFAGREVAALHRSRILEPHMVRLPELRMPRLTHLSETEQSQLRATVESAFLEPQKLAQLMGSGELGKLFPRVFGDHADGGIVGRPQVGAHDLPVDAHTIRAIEKLRADADFHKLPPHAQTNVLWAVLLHDTGKRAGVYDPGHEKASASIAHGVLGTLGYSPEQITRIAELINWHTEASYRPGEPVADRAANAQHIGELAVRYRNPYAVEQLRLMNKADIRAVANGDKLFTAEVATELDAMSKALAAEVAQSGSHVLPVLTSALPGRFTMVVAGDYVLYAHTTPDLLSFFRQRSLVESPEFSASVSIIRPGHGLLFDNGNSMFPILKGPFESTAQASRDSTYSGSGVGWHGHVRLARSWAAQGGRELAVEVGGKLQKLGFGTDPLTALNEVRRQLAGFNNLDELNRTAGSDSPLARAHKTIIEALTTERDGSPLEGYNESKISNATIAGLAIVRQGRSIVLEGLGNPAALTGSGESPSWLKATAGQGSLVVPRPLWSQIKDLGLPIVVIE